MKYSIQGFVKTVNSGRIIAAKNAIPSIDDPRVYTTDYRCDEDVEIDGVPVLAFNVNFNNESDRNGVFSIIKRLEGIIQGCHEDSYLKRYKYRHDETPKQRCETEEIIGTT